jgi:hypothetical protein
MREQVFRIKRLTLDPGNSRRKQVTITRGVSMGLLQLPTHSIQKVRGAKEPRVAPDPFVL